jgi:hypothetical protein
MALTVFGKGAVQTAYVSYSQIDLNSDVQLEWPSSYIDLPFTDKYFTEHVACAASLGVLTHADNPFTISLPPLKGASVGSNIIVQNIGEAPVTIIDNEGTNVCTISAGQNTNTVWIQLVNVDPEANHNWSVVNFGVGESAVAAGALAGPGLRPSYARLTTTNVVKTIRNDYDLTLTDQSKTLVWNGGEGNINLSPIISVFNGFFVGINNTGSGPVHILCADSNVINDELVSLTIMPGVSLIIVASNEQWWTLGYDQRITSNYFPDGTSVEPSISFINARKTGLYHQLVDGHSLLGVSSDGVQVSFFSEKGLHASALELNIPLEITSGGTGANDKATAIKNLMPVAATPGEIVYFGLGGNWITLPIAAHIGDVLSAGVNGIPTWVAPFTPPAATKGSVLTANGAEWVGLPIGAEGQLLKSVGGTPTWTNVPAVPPAAAKGTMLVSDGTNWVPLAVGQAGQVLTVVGGVPTWANK